MNTLVNMNDPILKEKTKRFDFENPPMDPVKLARELAECMLQNNGVGLAAPQIGYPYRVFVIKSNPILCCYNPIIVDMSEDYIDLEEGCLTYPGLFLKIRRPDAIKVRFTRPDNKTITEKYQGITARIFLHEYDHLEGVVFTSHKNRIALEMAMKRAKKYGHEYNIKSLL